jgi:hypothetical protein
MWEYQFSAVSIPDFLHIYYYYYYYYVIGVKEETVQACTAFSSTVAVCIAVCELCFETSL